MRAKLIILDFDGTLGDTREIILRTNQELLRLKGYPIPSDRVILDTVGLPLEQCFLAMFPDFPREELPEWVAAYRQIFEDLRSSVGPSLFPGVLETMERLYREGYRLSVASSRGRASLRSLLSDLGLGAYVCYSLGKEDVFPAKPEPEPVLKTLRDLGFSAGEALVVGDMPVDILMGRRAGVLTCGVSYGNSSREALLEAGADYIIDDFPSLINIL
ncbi:MAG: HAD family hydrolase [Bacteroidales bacterium]|nr:HAD family hydrolase [Bacteroidales bacterium]